MKVRSRKLHNYLEGDITKVVYHIRSLTFGVKGHLSMINYCLFSKVVFESIQLKGISKEVPCIRPLAKSYRYSRNSKASGGRGHQSHLKPTKQCQHRFTVLSSEYFYILSFNSLNLWCLINICKSLIKGVLCFVGF